MSKTNMVFILLFLNLGWSFLAYTIITTDS